MIEHAKKHWLFLMPLLVFAGYYSLQNIIGFMKYPALRIALFLFALALSAAAYILTYRVFPTAWADRIAVRLGASDKLNSCCIAIVVAFLAVIVISCITADNIPIVEAFKGASADTLANDRNEFLRGRQGAGQILSYAFAMMSQAFMPLAVAYGFWSFKSWRYLAAAIFAAGCALTLSKAAFLCISAPLAAIFLMDRRWLAASAAILGFVLSVGAMYYLASGAIGASMPESERSTRQTQIASISGGSQVAMPSDVPMEYNVFGKRTQTLLIANRILWIPYATAIDWFRYQEEKLDGGYVFGQSIRPIAMLTGKDRIFLESEVAELQWGGPSGATSNAVYFADAWLNWGAAGVILYSAIFAATIKLIISSGNPPVIAASAMPVWIACFSALPPVYFSAGLGFLLMIALAFRAKASAAPVSSAGVKAYPVVR